MEFKTEVNFWPEVAYIWFVMEDFAEKSSRKQVFFFFFFLKIASLGAVIERFNLNINQWYFWKENQRLISGNLSRRILRLPMCLQS